MGISSSSSAVANVILDSLLLEAKRCVQYTVDAIQKLISSKIKEQQNENNNVILFKIGTFSRSSTILSIIKQLLEQNNDHVKFIVYCSRSIPGNEGELMAKDLHPVATCIDDEEFISTVH